MQEPKAKFLRVQLSKCVYPRHVNADTTRQLCDHIQSVPILLLPMLTTQIWEYETLHRTPAVVPVNVY